MPDLKTIFIFNTFVLFLLAVYLLTMYKKNKTNKAMQFTTYFVVFYTIGLILFVSRNNIPDFLSIVVANTFFAAASINLYIVVRTVCGVDSSWHVRYFIPMIVMFLGYCIFTYIVFDTLIRMIMYHVFTMSYLFIYFWFFWVYSSKRFKIFDKFSALFFLLGGFIFLTILLRMSFMDVTPYYFANNDIFIYLSNVYLLMVNIWVIALVGYRIRN